MCGIICRLSRRFHSPIDQNTQSLLHARGPDSLDILNVKTPNDKTFITFVSSVLSLRGDHIVKQPLQNSGFIFCWNGEAWSFDNVKIDGNDTEAIFKQLVDAKSHQAILNVFSKIKGPYACIFYDKSNNRVYYGRDCLGRRSIVKATTKENDLIISSIPFDDDLQWIEVDAEGIFYIDLIANDNESWETHLVPHKHQDELTGGSVVVPYSSLNMSIVSTIPPPILSQDVDQLDYLLLTSTRSRLLSIQSPLENPIAILFSGGLDSALLAYYAHAVLPSERSIDLLNIAFQNPRIHGSTQDPYSLCPDRISGIDAYNELRATYPNRNWRLVTIDIPFTETIKHRPTIKSLMRPHKTEMDLSIATALYFAARGSGTIHNPSITSEASHAQVPILSQPPYTTPSRILLSGLGADELFAGYARHAIAYSRGGWPALLNELALDAARLGKRNLGRDDRVMAHWAREVRYVFLDENVVGWAMAVEGWRKAGFGKRDVAANASGAEGESLGPEKQILRILAARAGLPGVAAREKRAIQFGSRTAKMEKGGKLKGTDEI